MKTPIRFLIAFLPGAIVAQVCGEREREREDEGEEWEVKNGGVRPQSDGRNHSFSIAAHCLCLNKAMLRGGGGGGGGGGGSSQHSGVSSIRCSSITACCLHHLHENRDQHHGVKLKYSN